MHLYTLRAELCLPLCMRDAFTLLGDPARLPELLPPWLGLHMTAPRDGLLRPGAELGCRLRWLGAALTSRVTITEYEPPFYCAEEWVQGPFALWRQRRVFRPRLEGTLVQDVVEYALPFGLLGRCAHQILLGGQLRKIFEYRQNAATKLAGGRWKEPVVQLGELKKCRLSREKRDGRTRPSMSVR